jgi:hypothetical protein
MNIRPDSLAARRLIFVGVLMAFILPGYTQQLDGGWKPTPLELSQLPKYCQGQFKKELAQQPGYSIIGCGGHFGHFCPALVALKRAENVTAPMKDRQYNRGRASKHLKYTRDSVPATCPLLRELTQAESRLRLLELTLK